MVPGGAPHRNNTNQEDDSRFVLFFARDFFTVVIKFENAPLVSNTIV